MGKYAPHRILNAIQAPRTGYARDTALPKPTKPPTDPSSTPIENATLALPTASGHAVGAVSVKATDATATAYPVVSRRALVWCGVE